jgi:hypothetical protein
MFEYTKGIINNCKISLENIIWLIKNSVYVQAQ